MATNPEINNTYLNAMGTLAHLVASKEKEAQKPGLPAYVRDKLTDEIQDLVSIYNKLENVIQYYKDDESSKIKSLANKVLGFEIIIRQMSAELRDSEAHLLAQTLTRYELEIERKLEK